MIKLARSISISAIAFLGAAVSGAAQAACTSPDAERCKVTLATGIDMTYLEVGPQDGPAVILIHGLTDNARSWFTTMESLHRINPAIHVMAVDLRGHGGSSMPDAAKCAPAPEACFRPADFADDIIAFLGAKGITKADLAGHSLGSIVVQEVALTRPELVGHAILNATAANAVGNVVLQDYVLKEPVEGSWKKALEAKGKSYPADFYELTPLDADPQVSGWLSVNWVVDPAADPEFLKPYLPETASVKLGTWIGATKALLMQDNSERLKDMTVPTLVQWGTQDNIFPGSDQDAVKASLTVAAGKHKQPIYWKAYGSLPLPASGLQETDIGHNVQWSAFDMVAQDINAFITTNAPTSDLVRSDAANVKTLIVEPGKAVLEKIGG
jgi:pimeloyl-ACP methyl ester carboxylesterase